MNLNALVVSEVCVNLNALTIKKKYPKKVEAFQFAYTSCQKELNTIKEYHPKKVNEDNLLFEINRSDVLATDMCPDTLSRKY